MSNFTIRTKRENEVEKIADFISRGYYDDIYFHWVVDDPADRHEIVKAYYIEYAGATGAVVHVAETDKGEMVGASVWLPHDLDQSVSKRVYEKAGKYAPQFKEVGKKSVASCPPIDEPYFELVAVVTAKHMRGKGVGAALLKYHLDILDEQNIPTYLEASTPYHGDGLYAKFGYQQCGELLVFTDTAVLYPLWRPAQITKKVDFGGYKWRVLNTDKDLGSVLLISNDIVALGQYHKNFEEIGWFTSSLRTYLNSEFLERFSKVDRGQILQVGQENLDNPWYAARGFDDSKDNIFCLSLEEVVKYFGDSGQLKNAKCQFFIDDIYNDNRKATMSDGSPARWLLRTPGKTEHMVTAVTVDGRILMSGDFVNRESSDNYKVGIRPAMWVEMEALNL